MLGAKIFHLNHRYTNRSTTSWARFYLIGRFYYATKMAELKNIQKNSIEVAVESNLLTAIINNALIFHLKHQKVLKY